MARGKGGEWLAGRQPRSEQTGRQDALFCQHNDGIHRVPQPGVDF